MPTKRKLFSRDDELRRAVRGSERITRLTRESEFALLAKNGRSFDFLNSEPDLYRSRKNHPKPKPKNK